MKFIHLGDLHLGRKVNEFDLLDDQKYILDQILDIIDNNSVEAALLAGDIYDKAIPRVEAVDMLDYFLNELVNRNVKIFIISGNHDSDERLNFGSNLFEKSGVYIYSKYNGELQKQFLKDEFGNINIYLMPFIKASQVKQYYKNEEISSYNDAVKVVLKNTQINKSERNIIVAHQFVAGKSDPDLGGSESLATISVGTIEKVGVDCFDCFDYVALGHIHSPQKLERESIRYSGSPLKYSLKEINNTKSVPIITFSEKGKVDIELIELKPMRDMRQIKGRLKQLLSPENIVYPKDFISVTLTDEEPPVDFEKSLRSNYPNLIHIDFENSHTANIKDKLEVEPMTQRRNFKEIISEFYKLKFNTDISEEELQIMLETAREAGVDDEAY